MKIGAMLYGVMKRLPGQFLKRSMWWGLRKCGVAKRLCDEWYWKLQLLGTIGEVYRHPQRGGGICSLHLWQKLYGTTDLMRQCCDKYAVREYVRRKVGDKYLNGLLPGENSYWTDPDEIDFNALPNAFVLKCNNGSHMNILVPDKSKLDIAAAKDEMRSWMACDYATTHREWQYKDMPRKIICERSLFDKNGNPPEDIKIFCTRGKPLFLWVDVDRFTDRRTNLYTPEWEFVDAICDYQNNPNRLTPRPENLDEMMWLASKLSEDFNLVRVDLFNVDGRLYFGELTFTSGMGLEVYKPFSFSQKIARQVVLPPEAVSQFE